MHMVVVTEKDVKRDMQEFIEYSLAVTCGPSSDRYRRGWIPEDELSVVVGAVFGCLQIGIDAENDIVGAVARFARRTRSTVRTILHTLTGGDPSVHFWRERDGRFAAHPTVDGSATGRPRVAIVR